MRQSLWYKIRYNWGFFCWQLRFWTVKTSIIHTARQSGFFCFLPEFSAVSNCLLSWPSPHVSQIFPLSLCNEFDRRIYREILEAPGKQWGWSLHLRLGASSRTRTRPTERRDGNPRVGKTLSPVKEGFCSGSLWAKWAPNQAGGSNSLQQLFSIALSLFKSLFADGNVVVFKHIAYCLIIRHVNAVLCNYRTGRPACGLYCRFETQAQLFVRLFVVVPLGQEFLENNLLWIYRAILWSDECVHICLRSSQKHVWLLFHC